MTAKQHRAVTDEQRLARRRDLLDAAWDLFQDQPYDSLNMLAIAKRAGVAKGTLYLYFATKEELFLAVETRRLDEWFTDLNARLEALAGCADPAEVAAAVCRSLAERPALARLLAILHVTLEHNIEYPAALQFKDFLLAGIQVLGQRFEACLPGLAPGQGVRLALWTYACLIGLQQLANPAPVVRDVLAREPRLAPFRLDFETQCCQALHALYAGAVR